MRHIVRLVTKVDRLFNLLYISGGFEGIVRLLDGSESECVAG